MRSVHNFADRSADRPSLLMRYMAAIGPGVVICRGGPNDIRYDGTSLEILRSKLEHYAFLPIGNAHYTDADRSKIESISERFAGDSSENSSGDSSQKSSDQTHFEFYKEFNQIGVTLFKDWAADILAQKQPDEYPHWIRRKYQLPETTPLILVGSPEGFQGWPALTDDVQTMRPDHPTELFEILDDCGYARRFRLVGFAAEKIMGVYDFHHAGHHRYWPVRREKGIKDVGLIYLSRTSKGRIVLIIAGSSHSYGTFAGIRICADHGRTELNHLVEQFINGKIETIAVPYSCAPAIPGDSEDWITANSPVHAELHIDAASNYSELAIRELEQRLSLLQPSLQSMQTEASYLTQYFRQNQGQGLSALTKSYPVDQRDDSTSQDLLLSLLPKTRIYPVPVNLPWNHKGDIVLPNDFGGRLTKILEAVAKSQQPRQSDASVNETSLESLARLDSNSFKKFNDWEQICIEQAQKQGFHKWVESQYYFPSSNLLIVGSPESHLGYVPPTEWADYKDLPQLAKLLQQIGYPNRFVLKGSDKKESKLYDRKSMTLLWETVPNGGADYSVDTGLIYLARGLEGQIVIIVAGNGWLGTLGGMQLLFAERRPLVDAAIKSFLDGERKSVDIAYSCRRIEPSKRATIKIGDRSISDTKDKEQKEHNPFAISHPAVELDVNLIGEDQLKEFKWSSVAEELFRPLWKEFESPSTANKPIGDDSISMALTQDAGNWNLNLSCKNRLRIDEKHVVFCSAPTAQTYRKLEEDFRDAIEKLYSPGRFCYRLMVVGPTGVGKEGAAIFLHNLRDASCRKFEQLNMAAFSENLIGSELFGHVKGYYTGADNDRVGIFEFCKDMGMVVLDEFLAGMESLQKTLQPMLLRVLEDSYVVKLGDQKRTKEDVRICVMATTNEFPTLNELDQAVADKRVRSDLIARFPNRYELLPISSRPLEILPSFLWTLSNVSTNGRNESLDSISAKFTVDALKLLLHYNYPENFRQLQHAATRIAKSSRYKSTSIITREMVLNALMDRTAVSSERIIDKCTEAAADAEPTQLQNVAKTDQLGECVVNVKLEWEQYAKQKVELTQMPRFYRFMGTKNTGDTQRTYPDFIKKIIFGKVFRNQLRVIGEKQAKMTELSMAKLQDVEISITDAELEPVINTLHAYLSAKEEGGGQDGVKQEFREWLKSVHENLADAFPYNEERCKQVIRLAFGFNELHRAMVVWLLSGVRIIDTEFVELLGLPAKASSNNGKKEKGRTRPHSIDEEDVDVQVDDDE